MQVKFNLKPAIILKAETKEELQNAISKKGIYTYSSFGSGIYDQKRGEFIVANFQKFNKKTEQTKNKQKQLTKSTFIRKKHWVAYVYFIKTDLLSALNLKIKQNPRNFKISKNL